MSIYRIKMNGKTYEMEIELIEEGKPKNNQPAPLVNRPVVQEQVAVEINSNTVTAPMPGSIIKVVAKPGDQVEKRDVILILEAMKMENEVCAPKTGKIKAIYVTEGQAVSIDAPLFEMEE